MATLIVVTVHPAVTRVRSDDVEIDIPTTWFPVMPVAGQTWKCSLDHIPSDAEAYKTLNSYLARE